MPDPIQPDPVDEGLRALVTEPSYAAQVLNATARLLELGAPESLTVLACERALDVAADGILRTLPEVVHRDSLARAAAVLPLITEGITRGEYALQLRDAARRI
ncbi:hypothetical protein ACFVGN_27260 [Streptomyces sp. NPDC057757]|uniref:hypothetical protein n=1 Tax=Streptomyces sp. NPDC057757 TaxID=3346241 RepID=UPI0036D1E15F